MGASDSERRDPPFQGADAVTGFFGLTLLSQNSLNHFNNTDDSLINSVNSLPRTRKKKK